MMNEAEMQPKQLGSMTTDEIMAGIKEYQHHIDLFVEQLTLRASIQGYTKQQYDELLTLVQEAMMYVEGVPVTLEWVDRRNELLARIREQL